MQFQLKIHFDLVTRNKFIFVEDDFIIATDKNQPQGFFFQLSVRELSLENTDLRTNI